MANSANQNPANKAGRHSGAGPGGISEIVPTPQEAARGLEPLHYEERSSWTSRLGVGLGLGALVGAGVAAFRAKRARDQEQQGLRGRIKKRVKKLVRRK